MADAKPITVIIVNYIINLLYTVTIIALLCTSASAAYFETLSIEDGLSQSTVISIAQDRYGFIWLGTADGLNRYDGVQFIQFDDIKQSSNSESALTDARINYLTTDKNGNLWATTIKGLNFFNTTTYQVKRFTHNPQNPNSLPHNATRAPLVDSKGHIWFGTDIGLSKYNTNTNLFKLLQNNQTNDNSYNCSPIIRSLAIDSNDHIYVGTRRGLCKFNPETNQFTLIDIHNNLNLSASINVTNLVYNSKGFLWIGTSNGLFRYDFQSMQSISYFHNPGDEASLPNNWVTDLIESSSDHLWVGTINGLGKLDLANGKFTNYTANLENKNSLSNNYITVLEIDHSGLLLIGTNGGGLNIFNLRQQAFKHIGKNQNQNDSLSDSVIWEITKAYDYTWIGTANGLNRYDTKTNIIKHYLPNPKNKNSLPHHNIVDIDTGNNRDLWIATWNGVSRFTVDDERFENYQHSENPETFPLQNIISLFYDKQEDLVWVGSYGQGITVLNPKTQKFTLLQHDPSKVNSLRNNYVTLIHKSTHGRIWVGTREGIDRYYPDTKSFDHLDNKQINIGEDCYSIRELSGDRMIIASNNGLSIINPKTDELIQHYTKQDGLDDDFIYSTEIDHKGYIWVSTNFGISRINPASHEIQNFNILDGLQGYEFNGDASYFDGEYLYFGGYNGANYFKPEDIDFRKFIPPVAITGFSIHNQPVKSYLITDPIQLTYQDDFFSIEYAALDFTHPKKNQYAYKLEGFDQEWIYSKNRNFASYTNLDGGEYTFHVKAANKYGIWNEHGTSLAISITPPFWKTTWFRVLSIILTIFIIFSIYALRVSTIKARNKILKDKVKARTADLNERTIELENTLLELGETKDALIEAAHKAGMADTATAVLHNIGNLLNSVKISASLIREAINTSVSNKFLKANHLLLENKNNIIEFLSNDPKGGKILNYLMALGTSFEKENSELNDNTNRLSNSIDSIEEAIIAQQRFVQHGEGFVEQLSLIDIVEESLLLQTGSIGRHEIKIVRNYYDDLPLINIQKAKLVQILINLYNNAKESMDACKISENILTIDVTIDKDFAYICYTDTGIGIDTDYLQKIFSHGFTTKPGGHGFGLHSCANYMTEMGGKMWAESSGPNQGATIILRFPLYNNQNHKPSTAA